MKKEAELIALLRVQHLRVGKALNDLPETGKVSMSMVALGTQTTQVLVAIEIEKLIVDDLMKFALTRGRTRRSNAELGRCQQ